MARINVEQSALTDPRFSHLGKLLGSPKQLHQFSGLGVMIHIWNHMTEAWSPEAGEAGYCVDYDTLSFLFQSRFDGVSLANKIRTANLGRITDVGSDFTRIRGTLGKIEWLYWARNRARNNGKRHSAEPTLVCSPAPAPAPAQKELLPDTSIQPSAELDPPSGRRVKPRKKPEPDEETMRFFLAFYGDYPRHEGRMEALRAFVKLNPDKDLLRTISRDIQNRINSGKWQPDVPDQVKFIPLPASYLNGRRWEDGQFA